MFDGFPRLPGAELPSLNECVSYIRGLGKPLAAQVLESARGQGRTVIQPRCGVGGHEQMLDLLTALEEQVRPEILTLTIDSHTRLRRFDQAARVLAEAPERLNGYPLVTHGWQRGRLLNEAVHAPLEVRHGSPDPRELFLVSVASGITSFEGGGASYNVPYVKDVPLVDSLAAWRDVDRACGELAEHGIVVERELFGTLTAVLMPPAISLAICVLEAVAAAAEGVRCISVSYPQGGNAVQDVAALRAIPELAAHYVPDGVRVHPVLHQFMGAFPPDRARADALILYGGLIARWGGATKVVVKTYQEALGIPDEAANVAGLRTTRVALSEFLDGFGVDEDAVAEEQDWILREVADLVEPVLAADDLLIATAEAFRQGHLDVPFSASVHAHGAVLPQRDTAGAIRVGEAGRLTFSAPVAERNSRLLGGACRPGGSELVATITADIERFSAPQPGRCRS